MQISISYNMIKDVLMVINKAKHPHFEHEMIDGLKNQLNGLIQDPLLQKNPEQE